MLDLSNKRKLYRVYTIKKSNGKNRVIYAPCDELKSAQKLLSKTLESQYVFPSCCVGFVRGRCIADAVRVHTNKDWVVTIDIKDFFPSITKKHLVLFLEEYDRELATYNGKLVQGSPCSPIISNIVMMDVDKFFDAYFKFFNKSYSRYAD